MEAVSYPLAGVTGTKVLFNNGAASTALPIWKQWNINLSTLRAAVLKSVKTLALGLGDGKTTGTGTIYVDGVAVRTGTTTVLPKDLGVTTQNWVGRSEYTTDPFFNGQLDDFRIYNVALTAGQVRYLAGDR
jgi:hypothetical protein